MKFKIPLSARIAYRYLMSKKTYSMVNHISIVSICGVAVATMAIVCVLSVFNGFQDVLGGKLDQLSADVKVTSLKGKVIESADSLIDAIESLPEVAMVMPMVEDNALAIYNRRQLPVRIKGVDADKYSSMTAIQSIVKEDGRYALVSDIGEATDAFADSVTDDVLDENALFAYADELYADELTIEPVVDYQAVISVGVAVSLKAHPDDSKSLGLYVPRRLGMVNMGNPAASFISDSLSIAGVFQADQAQYDENTVIVDIALARRMFQYDAEATSIEINLKPGADLKDFCAALSESLGASYVVQDRHSQQEVHFKMINIEKWVTFLLLAFILLIASFNMISSMSMLIVEKVESIKILHNLGASRAMIGNVFRWESCFVNIVGSLSGIVVGLVLCLLQQHFGLIKLNGEEGSLIISAYPVKVLFTDMVIVLVPIFLIGLLTSMISAHYAKSSLNDE